MDAATANMRAASDAHRGAVRVRPFAAGDAARWDAFVDALPGRDVLPPRRLARHPRATSSAIARHYLLAERDGVVAACCRWPRSRAGCSATRWCRCRSACTAARVADDEAAERALIDAAVALARSLGVEHLELRNRARASAPTGRSRTSTSRSARRCCPTPRRTCWRSRASSGRWCARASARRLRSEIDDSVRSLLRAVRRQRAPPRHAAAAAALLRASCDDVFGDALRGADRHRRGRQAGVAA